MSPSLRGSRRGAPKIDAAWNLRHGQTGCLYSKQYVLSLNIYTTQSKRLCSLIKNLDGCEHFGSDGAYTRTISAVVLLRPCKIRYIQAMYLRGFLILCFRTSYLQNLLNTTLAYAYSFLLLIENVENKYTYEVRMKASNAKEAFLNPMESSPQRAHFLCSFKLALVVVFVGGQE